MSKFTPGPWGIEKSSVITEELEICDISYCDKNGSGKWIFGELSQANARLIAAAPEMYAVLTRLVFAADAKLLSEKHKVIQEARDAIAKAEGRQ